MKIHSLNRALRWAGLSLLVLALAYRLLFIWSDPVRATTCVVDDAYYSLVIAKNLATGQGLTFDGTVKSDGFHPPIFLVMVPVYFFSPEKMYVPIQVLQTVLSLFFVVSGLFIRRIAFLLFGPVAAFLTMVVWVCSDSVFNETMNGCDTSMAIAFGAGTLSYYLGWIRSGRVAASKGAIVLGVLIGLTALMRIDQILLLVVLLGDLAYVRWKEGGAPRLRAYVKEASITAACAFSVLAPWPLFVFLYFGSPLPQGGRIVRYVSWLLADIGVQVWNHGFDLISDKEAFRGMLERTHGLPGAPMEGLPLEYYLFNLVVAGVVLVVVMPAFRALLAASSLLFPAGWGHAGLFITAVVPIAVCGLVVAGRRGFARLFARAFQRGFGVLCLYAFIILLAYIFYIYGPWFFNRYLFPVTVLIIFFLGGLGAFIVEGRSVAESGAGETQSARRPGAIRLALVVLLSVPFLCLAVNQGQTHWKGEGYFCLPVTRWINENLPEDARIGALQSGTLAYYCRRQVFNLDGKTSRAAYAASAEKRMFRYVLDLDIDYIVDWKPLIRLGIAERSSQPVFERLELVHQEKQEGYFGGFHVYRVLAPEEVEAKGGLHQTRSDNP